MEPGDDYVNTCNAQGQTTAVPLVELHDQRERGRLCIPLIGDTDRDRLSGRAARRAHLDASRTRGGRFQCQPAEELFLQVAGVEAREAGLGLAAEILEAYQGQGNAIRKRDEVHKMAQANKAFAHFRW